jgi:hypothetical protein
MDTMPTEQGLIERSFSESGYFAGNATEQAIAFELLKILRADGAGWGKVQAARVLLPVRSAQLKTAKGQE